MLFRSGLVVYGILIFPQSTGYVDAVVVDLIEQINNQANPIPAIIAETIRSLNFYRRKGEGNFIGCAQLLYMWIEAISGASAKPPSNSI